jgi:hypothetical protein
MRDIVQRLEYSDASRLHFVALSNRSPQFLTDISQIFFSGELSYAPNQNLTLHRPTTLNFVLDVLPECAVNGGKDRLCVNRCLSEVPTRSESRQAMIQSLRGITGVVCGQQRLGGSACGFLRTIVEVVWRSTRWPCLLELNEVNDDL